MLGEKLKSARQAAGMTQQQVANIIGVDRSAYTYYELGKSDVATRRLLMLSTLFGVSVSELLSENPPEVDSVKPFLRPGSDEELWKQMGVLAVSVEERALLAKMRLIRGMGKQQELNDCLERLSRYEKE